jgi:hypothetical protein
MAKRLFQDNIRCQITCHTLRYRRTSLLAEYRFVFWKNKTEYFWVEGTQGRVKNGKYHTKNREC